MARNLIRRLFVTGALLALAARAGAQPPPPPPQMSTLSFIGPEIPLAPRVEGAPFSADASTQITQTLGDGTRIEQTTAGKVFRDGAGRVRREMTILGLSALDPSVEGQSVITIVDPVAGVRYVLDPRTKEARRVVTSAGFEARQSRAEAMRRGSALLPPPPPPPPPPPGESLPPARPRGAPGPPASLGTQQLLGLTATGTRRTETIPSGRIGNDRPIEITDERWESAELKVLLLSRHHDPRTGDVEYRLTNLVRGEPPRGLFTIPSEYRIIDVAPPQ
jgi:hypothetical protein